MPDSHLRGFREAAVLIAAATALLPMAAAGQQAFGVSQAPSWVQRHDFDPGAAPSAGQAQGGHYLLLYDDQTRVATRQEWFTRRVLKALNPAGIDAVSQVSVQFDPEYQELDWHEIVIWRDGERLDRLRPEAIRVLHREQDLEARIYDGRLTADVVLEDVRSDDIVDYSYTIRGANPVFDGRFDGTFATRFDIPVHRVRQRLLFPADRQLHTEVHGGSAEPVTRVSGDEVVYSLDLDDIPATPYDGDTPGWFDDFGWVQLSEWRSWAEVVAWGVPLYTADPESVRAQAMELTRAHPSTEEQVLAVLRFVQDEVRYVGFEMGRGSHEPRPPATVLSRRFGDCKDKALLMVSLLQAIEIDAHPVFVRQSGLERRTGRWPTALAFDHVIVAVELDGQRYWLDPTRSRQRGTLHTLHQPDHGLALVVAPGTTGLVEMDPPRSARPAKDIIERYELTADGEATLSVTTVFRGGEADYMRSYLGWNGREKLERGYLNYYARRYPGISLAEQLIVNDDERGNELALRERYHIADFWEEDHEGAKSAEFYAGEVADYLTRPRITRRTTPLATGGRQRIRQLIRVTPPEPWPIQDDSVRIGGEAFSLVSTTEYSDGVLVLLHDLRITADEVMPEQVDAHLERIDSARDNLSYSLTQGAPIAAGGVNWLLLVVLLGALAAAGSGARIAYRYEPGTGSGPPFRRDPSLDGLRGWLILVGIGMVLAPLIWLGAGLGTVITIDAATWDSLTRSGSGAYHPLWAPTLLFGVLASGIMAVLATLAAVLFFKRRSSFPFWFQALMIGNIVVALLESGLLSSLPGAEADADPVGHVRAMVWSGIWILYCRRSRRVASTFTRSLSGASTAPADLEPHEWTDTVRAGRPSPAVIGGVVLVAGIIAAIAFTAPDTVSRDPPPTGESVDIRTLIGSDADHPVEAADDSSADTVPPLPEDSAG